MGNFKAIGLLVFWLLFLGILCYLSVITLGNFFDKMNFDRNYVIDSSWEDGIGTLTETKTGKIGTSKFEYTYDGKLYNFKSRLYFNGFRYTKGEKYLLKINPAMPDHFLPVMWSPLFLKDEITAKTWAKLGNIHSEWMGEFKCKCYYFVYDYNVNSSSYVRIHYLAPDYQKTYGQLEKGSKFEVEYWLENPQRAIIHLDRPMK